MPAGFERASLDIGLAAGFSVSGLYGPLKAYRERQLARIFASGQTLRLQFPKEDLGFVYDKPGAAICTEAPNPGRSTGRREAGYGSGTEAPEPGRICCRRGNGHGAGIDGTAVGTSRRGSKETAGSVGGSDRQYWPSCVPGGRLPHCTIYPINAGKTLLCLTWLCLTSCSISPAVSQEAGGLTIPCTPSMQAR